jgi:hypothetical protein
MNLPSCIPAFAGMTYFAGMTEACGTRCLIYQANLPNELGNYIS